MRIRAEVVGRPTSAFETNVEVKNGWKLDWGAPTPPEGAAITGSPQVVLLTSDDALVRRVEFLWNGALIDSPGNVQTLTPYDPIWDTSKLPEGPGNLVARVERTDGVFYELPRAFVVDHADVPVPPDPPLPSGARKRGGFSGVGLFGTIDNNLTYSARMLGVRFVPDVDLELVRFFSQMKTKGCPRTPTALRARARAPAATRRVTTAGSSKLVSAR